MRFAWIYPEPTASSLAEAIRRSDQDALVGIYDGDVGSTDWARWGVRCVPGEVDSVLNDPQVDAVLVGRGGSDRERDSVTRLLVQAGIPIILVVPLREMLFGFELQMIQVESQGLVFPYFPGILHPAFDPVASDSSDPESTLGPIQRLDFLWQSPDHDPETVRRHFFRDAVISRRLLGRILRLSAMLPNRAKPGDWGSLSVQMADERGRAAGWTKTPSPRDRSSLKVTGVAGERTVELSGPPRTWTVTDANGRSEPLAEDLTDDSLVLRTFRDAVSAEPIARSAVDELWDHVCRAAELADMVAVSASRGRAVELSHEEHSEEATFKGVMAAGGCFAILGALLLIPIVALLERLFPGLAPNPAWRKLPWVVLSVVLAAFLATQFLRNLATKSGKTARS